MPVTIAPRNKLLVVLSTIIAFIFTYYCGTLLHEWAHGTTAWLLGQKLSPFDIDYGHGWFLYGIDENVNYNKLLTTGHGITVALIGISGITVDIIFALLFFILLNRPTIQKNSVLVSFSYWSLILYMVPIIQYLYLSPFSWEGDTGRFVHGLNISALWIFIPGTILISIALWRIFTIEILRAYAFIPIRNIGSQRLFLIASLFILFLLIYILGYGNPFIDDSASILNRLLAILSILLVPILFFICNPSRQWVKKLIVRYRHQKQ